MSEYFVGSTGENNQTNFSSLSTSEVLDDLSLNTSDSPTFAGLDIESSGSTSAKVDLVGTYTTWSLENQYVNGATNDMFRIYNSQLGADSLTIHRLNNNVGIGATSPSVGLQLGNSVSGQTKTAIFNSEGGAEIGLTIKSRTNRAKLAVSDNDTSAYMVAEGGIASFGRADTAASTNISVLANGKVGIGTTSPSRPLSIHSSSAGSIANFLHYTDASNFQGLYIDVSQTTDIVNLKSSGASSGGFAFFGGNTERVRITSAGNVGIGTTSPSQKLHVVGNTTTTGVSYTDIIQTYSGSSIDFRHQDASVVMRVDTPNARVGIGTTSPAYRLHVAGTLGLTSSQYFTNNTAYIQTGSSWGNGVLNFLNGATTAITFDVPNNRIKNNLGKYLTASSGTGQFGTLDNQSVAIVANNSTKMTILSGGNVGIGTTSPSAKLEVIGTGSQLASTGYYINSSFKGSSNVGVFLGHNNTNNGNGMVAGINKLAFLTYGTSWGERMVIDGSGSVTINAGNLFLANSSSRISNGANGEIGFNYNTSATGSLVWYGGGTASKFSVTNAGNATFAGKVTSSTTVSNDAAATLTTKGYVDAAVAGGVSGSFLELSGGTITGNVKFNDSNKLILGTGSDLNIFHDSANSYFENKVGNLIIRQEADDASIIFQNDNGSGGYENYFELQGVSGGASPFTVFPDSSTLVFGNGHDLRMLHDASNSVISNYTGDLQIINNADDKDIIFYSDNGSGGITPYLTLDGSSTGLTVSAPQGMVFFDSIKAKFGNNDDLQIFHDGSHSYISDAGTGDLRIQGSNNIVFYSYQTSEVMASMINNGGVELYFDNSKKFATTTDGIQLYGNGYLDMPDNGRIRMGASYDLAIYHDGSHSYIQDTGTGNLNIQSNSLRLLGADSSPMLVANQGGAVNLYHNNSAKLETTSTGIYVGGNIQLLDSSSTSFGRITFGHGNDLQIYHDGTHSYLTNNVTGSLYIQSGNSVQIESSAGEDMITAAANGAVSLYFDNSKKLETATNGINVTGNVIASNNVYAGGANGFVFGSSTSEGEYIYRSGNDIRVLAGGADRLTVDGDNGNVGIGTTSPAEKLHVNGEVRVDANEGIATKKIRSSYFSSSQNLDLKSGASADIILTSDKVGIGTNNPNEKLEVSGRIKSSDGLLSNGFNLYAGSATTGFLIELDVASNNYAHIHGALKLQQFNVSSQQIINFSATTLNTGTVQSSAATADIDVTIKLFVYNSKWYIHVPSPSTYTDISAYVHLGAGYQGSSRASNCIINVTSAAVPSSGVSGSVDIVAQKRILANTSGNVGIGTTSPARKLHVSTGNTDVAARFENTTSNGNVIEVKTSGDNKTLNIQTDHIYSNMALHLGSDSYNTYIRGANVGIGTTSPTKKLHIDDSATLGTGLLVTGGGQGGPLARFTRDVGGSGSIEINSSGSDPQIQFASSANTFSLGTNSSTFEICDNNVVGTNTRLSINSSGNVGIGTNNPTSILDIRDTQTGGASEIKLFNLDQGNTTTQTSALRMTPDVRANGVAISAVKENADFSSSANKDVAITFSPVLNNAAAEKMRITSAGNVGIGKTSPSAPLHLYSAEAQMKFESSHGRTSSIYQGGGNFHIKASHSSGVAINYGDGNTALLNLYNNTTPAVSFSANGSSYFNGGNVGIGTTSPDAKLVSAGIVDGDFTALRLMNQKTYGSGTGTNEKVRFVMGISESGTAFSAREGFAIDVGIINESDSSNTIVNFGVRDGGTLGTYQTVNGHNKSVDFTGNVTVGGGQILTPSGTNLALNPNTGTVSVGGVIQCSGTGASTFAGDVVVSGGLTINGTTTTINSTTVQVDDKNIELGTVATPTDTTADGGGITLKGATDKTINWINSTDAWTFSERISIIPAGSASLPALTLGNDNDTGIYRETSGGNDVLSFSTDGTRRGFFISSGFHVNGSVYSGTGSEFRNYGGTWKATTGLTGNGFEFNNSVDGTALTISSTGDTVASGKITTGSSESVFGGSGSIPLYARSSGTISFVQIQNSSTGSGAGNGLTVGCNGTAGYLWLREAANLNIGTNDTTAITISSSQNTTFAGTISSGAITSSGKITGTELEGTSLDINGAADISGHLEVGEYILRSGQGSNYHRFLASRQIFVVGNASSIDLNNGTSTFGATGGATTLQGSSLLLDAAADITLDAGGQDIILSDDGTIFGTLSNSSGLQIRSRVNNADMLFRGVDNGTEFTALTLDMSAGGNATFAGDLSADNITSISNGGSASIYINSTRPTLGFTDSNSFTDANDIYIIRGANNDLKFQWYDDTASSTTDTFSIDNSGNATFAGNVSLGTSKRLYLSGTSLELLHDGSNAIFVNNTGDFKIQNSATDKDIIFRGKDGSSTITALTLDMSEGGNAIFAGAVTAGGHILPSTSLSYDLGSDSKRFASVFCHGFSATSSVTTPTIQLQGNLKILNKAQTAYLDLAARNTTDTEVKYDLNNVGSLNFPSGTLLTTTSGNQYLKLKYGSTGAGGIQVRDGADGLQGYLYADGASTPSFGLLHGGGSWAVLCRTNSYVQIRHNNLPKFQTQEWGLSFTGNTVASGNVYAGGANGFVFGSSTSEGEYIYRTGNDIRVFAGGDDRLAVDGDDGNVGINTNTPAYKLHVNGGIRAGGKVTYEKSAGSLDTTGYAVAGLVAGTNGASAGFTFTSFGHTGSYQKIVYSCYNASGTWNTQKVIDEGTNDLDVTASANGSTITFTFKSRSGTKHYTPRVLVEAVGQSLNNTYD
jgi:hypothetical protein